MTLASGARLGPYEIVGPLGAGGMGEVYKARDTRLDRTVAVKILPEALAADPQFRERFQREARAISQLEDPHICALYDVGEHGGTAYLVMQYLEGETLAEVLAKGSLPIGRALQTAVEIASALDKAHRAGIVHRDLKPGNVMLTKGGAKLLDFGLAKLSREVVSSNLSMLPTSPPNLTARGTILGTFQYMAPEQLEGKEADTRTDIFAFGAVLYEMLVGGKAFTGTSHASLIASIMTSHPPSVSTLQTAVPAELDRLVSRCLAKDPEDRWQSARDLRAQLSWIAEAKTSPFSSPQPRRHPRRLAWTLAALALAASIGTVAAVVLARRGPAAANDPVEFVILSPESASLSPNPNAQAISPDGRQVAFVASGPDGIGQRLWIRGLASLSAQPLAGTEGAATPFWSPDSRSVGYFAGGKLRKIDIGIGQSQTLADAPSPLGGSWSRDGLILFGKSIGSPIFQVPSSGGAETAVTSLDPSREGAVGIHTSPSFLPDGRHFLFIVSTGPSRGIVYVGSLDSTEPKLLLRADSGAVYSPSGHLLFVRDSTLMAQPFDLAKLSLSGDPVPVAAQVGRLFTSITFTVSDTGTLIYRPSVAAQTRLNWVDATGRVLSEAAPDGIYQEIALSPDDKRVAFARQADNATDIWLTDLERRMTSRFTFRPPVNNVPIWSPDGRQIIFASTSDGGLDFYRRASDTSGPEERLLRVNSQPLLFPSDWSADGKRFVYYRTNPKTQLDLWTFELAGAGQPVPFLQADYNESQGQFSPDGRWMAYVSDESGGSQIYVQSFPTPSGQRQISPQGGTQPRWRRDGKEMYYLAPDRKLMAVPVKTGPPFDSGMPRALFQTELSVSALRQTYAVSADGQRFLLNTSTGSASPPIVVVLNFAERAKR